jgi:S-methylmethionine-dependent homocysteine/selenocysteine methylase
MPSDDVRIAGATPNHAAERRAPSALQARLESGPPVLLDGALGTEIERRGGHAGLPLWSTHALLDDPDLVTRIHREYAAAGAEVLVADTFRTQARSLAHAGLAGRAAALCAKAVQLAREAAAAEARSVWVAGSAPPLEDCYRPDRVPDEAALRREHGEHVRNLVAAGADVIWIETINTVREARAALEACSEANAAAVVSFVCDGEARLLSGETLREALDAVTPLGPLAVGVNCLPAAAARAALPVLAAGGLPFLVYANLGVPAADGAFARSDALATEAFAGEACAWLAAGAGAVGGCCGTTPAHVAAIARRLGSNLPSPGGGRTQIASPRA